MADKPQKLKPKEAILALGKVAKAVYKASPGAVVIKGISALIDAVLPLVIAYYAAQATTSLADAYNGVSGAGDLAITYVLYIAALGMFRLIWSDAVRYIDELARLRISTMMQDRLMDKFTNLEFWRYEDKETADLYDKAEDFTSYAPRIFDQAASLFSSVVQLILSIAALFSVRWWFGLILLASVIPTSIIQLKISRIQMEFWRGDVAKRRSAGNIQWNVFRPENFAETRAYGVTAYLLALYRRLRNIDAERSLTVERKYIGGRIATGIIESVGALIVELTIILDIIARQQPIGQYVYVQQLVARTLGSASSIGSIVNGIDEELASLYEYEKFMELPDDIDAGVKVNALPEELRFENVSFTYPLSNQRVLKNVSLSIRRRQHIAIVGENGAGKSTLIKLLIGLYEPNAGSILLDGIDLRGVSKADWHRHIAVLQQKFIEYRFASVKENVMFGDVSTPFDETRFDKAISKSGVDSFVTKLPAGRDTILNKWLHNDDGKPGTELSGGQWQRVALARNLYRNAELIILDEPTSAIDALAEAKIFEHLFKESEKTIITISHRFSTVKKADVIYMLKDGELAESGDYATLIAKRGEFYTMFQSQIDE